MGCATVPAARTSLLDASARHQRSGENRLTEILASVLRSAAPFAERLCAAVELPRPARYDVSVQRTVAPGCIVDMVLNGRDEHDASIRLWSEHKTVSGYRDRQLEDYAKALDGLAGHRALVTIVNVPGEAPHGCWKTLSWQDIASLAVATGHAWGGDAWRGAALTSDAPAWARLVHELLWYLEREGFAVTRGLSDSDLGVFSSFPDTRSVLLRLLEQTGKYLEPIRCLGEPEEYEDGGTYWQLLEPTPESWLQGCDESTGGPEIIISREDGWSGSGEDREPVVGAGYTLHQDLVTLEDAALGSGWPQRLRDGGFSWELWAGYVRCYRTIPLSRLTALDSLDAQARELARFAREAVSDLDALDPGIEISSVASRPRR
jgi:hypothetical protein